MELFLHIGAALKQQKSERKAISSLASELGVNTENWCSKRTTGFYKIKQAMFAAMSYRCPNRFPNSPMLIGTANGTCFRSTQ